MLLVCICEPHHWPHARKISGFLQTCFGGKLSRLMSPIFPPSHNYVRPLRNCIKEPGYTRLDNPPFDGKVQVCAAALPRTCWRALLLLGHKKARKIGRGVTWMLSIFIHKAPDQMPHNSQRIASFLSNLWITLGSESITKERIYRGGNWLAFSKFGGSNYYHCCTASTRACVFHCRVGLLLNLNVSLAGTGGRK